LIGSGIALMAEIGIAVLLFLVFYASGSKAVSGANTVIVMA
jgi:hypothetical protein